MKIQMFHRYRRLADEGKVKPLACGICGDEYVIRATTDGDPLLQCFACDRIIQPGVRIYEQIVAVVKEHSD